MNKHAVALVLVALFDAGYCRGGPSGLDIKYSINGTWGGENAGVIADDTSAHVHIGCTYGQVHQRIVPDAAGFFDVPGEQNITAHPVDLGVMHPARFRGRVVDGTMTLTVALSDTAVTLGPVRVKRGSEPRMGPCPICRPGMDR